MTASRTNALIKAVERAHTSTRDQKWELASLAVDLMQQQERLASKGYRRAGDYVEFQIKRREDVQ